MLGRSLISRANLVVKPTNNVMSKRFVHIENTVGNNTPFSYANPKAFAAKLIIFYGGGFCIPFAAAYYQIRKASA